MLIAEVPAQRPPIRLARPFLRFRHQTRLGRRMRRGTPARWFALPVIALLRLPGFLLPICIVAWYSLMPGADFRR